MVAEERGVTKAAEKSCKCEACKRKRGEPSKLYAKGVENYSAQPVGGWRTMKSGADKPDEAVYLGVELETHIPPNVQVSRVGVRAQADRECPMPESVRQGRRISFHDPLYRARLDAEAAWILERNSVEERLIREREATGLTSDVAASMLPDSIWLAKHDGSVSGPEFASQPLSMKAWYDQYANLKEQFQTMLHAGLRSHEGDTAGMHVNISLASFADSDHLYRFAALINWNKTWALKMSQRTEMSTGHWCHIGDYPFSKREPEAMVNWARRVMTEGWGGADRYNALNTPGHGRLEFRLPRGTLRIDRFYKNLEWVKAMLEFTSDYEDTSPLVFMQWVMNTSRFPNLKNFIVEKYGVVKAKAPTPATVGVAGAVPPSLGALDSGTNDYGDDPFYDEPEEPPCDSDDHWTSGVEIREENYSCDCGYYHDLPLQVYEEPEDEGIYGPEHIESQNGEPIGRFSQDRWNEYRAERRAAREREQTAMLNQMNTAPSPEVPTDQPVWHQIYLSSVNGRTGSFEWVESETPQEVA